MNKESLKWMAAGLIALVLGAGTGSAAVTVPFADGFESGLNTTAWATNASGSVTVVSVSAAQGAQSCYITNSAMILSVAPAANATNVFCQVYAKPARYQGVPSTAGSAAVFFINSAGKVVTSHGSAWTTQSLVVAANTWVGFTVHLDYGSDKWDLYRTDGIFGSTMVKVNAAPLAFVPGTYSQLYTSRVDSTLGTYIDGVAIGVAKMGVGTGVGHSPTNVGSASYYVGSTNPTAIPAYIYSSANNTLSGQLGLDLGAGMPSGAKLRVYTTNNWNQYLWNGFIWSVDLPASTPVADLKILPSTYLWYLGNAQSGAGFTGYNDLPQAESITVKGSADPETGGWNAFTWPLENEYMVNSNEGLEWGNVPSNTWGDELYLYSEGRWLRYWWDFAGQRWMRGNAPGTEYVYPGQVGWIRRSASGNETWDVDLLP